MKMIRVESERSLDGMRNTVNMNAVKQHIKHVCKQLKFKEENAQYRMDKAVWSTEVPLLQCVLCGSPGPVRCC